MTTEKNDAELLTFELTRGKTAHLVIKNPPPKKSEKTDSEKRAEAAAKQGADEAGGDAAMAMMQEMFKDMRVAVVVEVAGKIVKTDAEHVEGNRATLTEIDFNKLLSNPEKFKELSKKQPENLEESKKLMKGIEGIRVESKPQVTIDFQ